MRNKIVGYIIIGISLLIGFIIFSFNKAMSAIVATSCGHGESCPMWGSIAFQTNISSGIMALIIAIGVYMVLFGDQRHQEDGSVSHPEKQRHPRVISQAVRKTLSVEEKKIVESVSNSEGAQFQSELVDSTGYTKVKVTRILDKLEGKGIIERKRRGMTNIVILK